MDSLDCVRIYRRKKLRVQRVDDELEWKKLRQRYRKKSVQDVRVLRAGGLMVNLVLASQ